MASLDDLAAFLVRYSDARGVRHGLAVRMILDSPALPGDLAKRAAMYGYAQEIGAADAIGFDRDWKP